MKNLKNEKKICSHASSSQVHDSFGEESLRINEYHQPSTRRAGKERQGNLKEVKVELPHFYGKKICRNIFILGDEGRAIVCLQPC